MHVYLIVAGLVSVRSHSLESGTALLCRKLGYRTKKATIASRKWSADRKSFKGKLLIPKRISRYKTEGFVEIAAVTVTLQQTTSSY